MATSVMTCFASLPDPRSPLGKRHVLSDMLTIAICAVICGADSWSAVEEFGRAKHKWFATFLELPHGIPSHDTFGRVFAALDPHAFEECFGSWVAALAGHRPGGELVSLDGKSIRRSFEHAWDQSGMAHLVSAFAGANRLVLGQVALAGRDGQAAGDNEITALPRLLDLLDLRGKTVSIDAIGCQRSLAAKVLEKQADYVLCVKENQPTLHAKLKALLDEAVLDGGAGMNLSSFQEVDGDHGRIETRQVWASDQVQHLRLPEPWPGLASVACVRRVREVIGVGGESSDERSYYVSSLKGTGADAHALGEAIRGHWGIENRLHWHLDVSFGEDACRVRKGHGAENFSRLRRIALNLLQRETTNRRGIKIKRQRAGWDHDYLLRVLTG